MPLNEKRKKEVKGEFLIDISSVIIVWGVAHNIPVKSIVWSFGEISKNNKLIISMEWIAEGLLLIFIGVINIMITLYGGW